MKTKIRIVCWVITGALALVNAYITGETVATRECTILIKSLSN